MTPVPLTEQELARWSWPMTLALIVWLSAIGGVALGIWLVLGGAS